MGVSYSAYTVVGIRVKEHQLYKEKRIRECKHPFVEDARFCPVCGKSMFSVEYESIAGYDEGSVEFLGFDVYGGTLNEDDSIGTDIFIGVGCLVDDEYEPKKFDLLNEEEVRNELKKKLEPLGLWNEKDFGIWTVLYCSY